jgi:hypothetical protein
VKTPIAVTLKSIKSVGREAVRGRDLRTQANGRPGRGLTKGGKHLRFVAESFVWE